MEKKIEQLIGAQLKARRTELGITKYRMNQLTGVHYGYLSELEAGKKSMSIGMLARLCDVLNLEIKIEPTDSAPNPTQE